jgi:ATP-dependent RNA helicase DDX51/DBP6
MLVTSSPTPSSGSASDTNTSLVDILICTPGRLLEHLQSTDGFTLTFLKYIVFDEADRLLSNAYDHWVRALMSSTNASKSHHFLRLHHPQSGPDSSSSSLFSADPNAANPFRSNREYLNNIPQIQRLMFSATLTDNPRKLSLSGVRNPLIIRTIASTPYTSAEEQTSLSNSLGESIAHSSEYMLPTRLKEWLCICDTTTRPLYLISILYQICGLGSFAATTSPAVAASETEPLILSSSSALTNICSNPDDLILIFTSSVETTHRLCRLLQLFNNQFERLTAPSSDSSATDSSVFGGQVQEINRLISSSKRTEILQIARQGSVIKILISSDQLARGIDLQNIRVVINYDSPSHPRTYVHRVGRTARANRVGDCITMIKKGNLSQFERMRSEIANVSQEQEKGQEQGRINKMKMDRVNILWKGMIGPSLNEGKGKRKRDEENKEDGEAVEEYKEIFGQYQRALQHLNKVLELESQKQLRIGEC